MPEMKATTSLRLRYIIGLSAIALLVTASYLTMQRIVSEQRNFSALVNLAGHQAGLSNRLAYFASLMATTNDETEFSQAKSQVGRTINKMEKAHKILRKGDPEKGIPFVSNTQLETIYEDPMVGLDLAIERFLTHGRTLYETGMDALNTNSASYLYLTIYGPHVLEPMLDAAVDQYTMIGSEAIYEIEALERIIWLAALFTLLLEVLFIFHPLDRRLRALFHSLESKVSELQATQERLLSAQQMASVGDWQWLWDKEQLTWSPEIYRICGVSTASFTPNLQNSYALVHADDLDRLREYMRDIRRGKLEGDHIEHRVIRPDGSEVWVSQHMSVLRDRDDNPCGLTGTLQDISERKESEAKIRELAMFDPLTGLANRRLLADRVEHALAAAHRGKEFGAVLMMDLDNFKTLNDTQGHNVGDALLIEVGERLCKKVRATDTIARLGGDEFVAVFEGLSHDEERAQEIAMSLAEDIRKAIDQPFDLNDTQLGYKTSVSIGFCLYCGNEKGFDELLMRADVAMFEAKDSGRNRTCCFSEERLAEVHSQTEVVHQLRQALENNEFQIYYQPQVSATGKIVGAEALLRWLPPDKDPVSPATFIPIAEETGLILPIGEWVFEQVCRDLNHMSRQSMPSGFKIAVNISPRQFNDPNLVDSVKATLKRYRIDARRLKVELTESCLVSDIDYAVQLLTELRGLGFDLELDDFGTGYSSLTSLKMLPRDTLKLDGTLVNDIEQGGSGTEIARAAIAMAKAMHLAVVAECVETEGQRQFLINEGCDTLQGYLFAKPMPYPALMTWLGQSKPLLTVIPSSSRESH